MIKIYSTNTCPDCINIEKQVKGNNKYEIINIDSHVRNLKEFIKIRDNSPVFDEAKSKGFIGIPCFVLEDGTITLKPGEAGLKPTKNKTMSCNIDGSGC